MDQSGDMFPKIELPEPNSEPEPNPNPTRGPNPQGCRCDIEVFEEIGPIPVLKPRRIRINGVEALTPEGAPVQVAGLIDGQPLTVNLTVFATSLIVHRVDPDEVDGAEPSTFGYGYGVCHIPRDKCVEPDDREPVE